MTAHDSGSVAGGGARRRFLAYLAAPEQPAS